LLTERILGPYPTGARKGQLLGEEPARASGPDGARGVDAPGRGAQRLEFLEEIAP